MKENLYTPHSIRTFTGKYFDYTVMDPDTIDIRDIAHALAAEPRFNGQTPLPYSVGQHSIMACLLAPDEFKLEMLLHDATEAYLKDIAKPLKALLPDYMALENKLENVINIKYNLNAGDVFHEIKKSIDSQLLYDEFHSVFIGPDAPYAWPREKVESVFLQLYMRYKQSAPNI